MQPGNNEITVVGLTPTVDEHSIKVEGTGSNATITDIAVELLPNRELFQDIYPDSDAEDESGQDDVSDGESENEAGARDPERKKVEDSLEAVREKLVTIRDDQHCAKEAIASAAARLKLLDAFGDGLKHKECKIAIEDGLETYRQEREGVFASHMDATIRERKIAKDIADLTKEENRLKEIRRKQINKASKSKRKALEAKKKQEQKQFLRKMEKQKEKARIRKERDQLWPRSCYTVRITLDSTTFTPSSSRRTSIASASDLAKPSQERDPTTPSYDDTHPTCDISLSYVTTSAFWSPSYDLALSTTTNTARVCFDASLTNLTSATWSNCKIILSNSQTTFSFNNDTIPTLKPWHVKLAGKVAALATGILDSREERTEKAGWAASQNAVALKPRAQHFGQSNNAKPHFQPSSENMFAQHMQSIPAQSSASAPMNVSAFGASQSAPRAAGLFGSSYAPPPPRAPAAAPAPDGSRLFSNIGPEEASHPTASAAFGNAWENNQDVDGATILEPTPELSFQESSFEETGLTTTHDLPGLKTLKPSSTTSKQRIAHISFTNVIFSRTVVAKYKPVAYLKVKLRNSSKLTLLRGPTGLTLDGTFMGRSTLPRCSAGDSFVLSLGVDPAIRVSYPKPEIKRSTSGLFTKEESSVYTRTITLLNTRAASGKHVNITVLDQVPVSEDEKLRVGILHPRGMTVGGNAVMTGVASREGEKEWGRANAVLKKAGEVVWDVALNAGRSVKLTLEYEVVLPTGEHVAQC